MAKNATASGGADRFRRGVRSTDGTGSCPTDSASPDANRHRAQSPSGAPDGTSAPQLGQRLASGMVSIVLQEIARNLTVDLRRRAQVPTVVVSDGERGGMSTRTRTTRLQCQQRNQISDF